MIDKDSVTIRRIHKNDNTELAEVLRKVLVEMGVPKKGTAYEDEALDCMFETYNNEKMDYFVVTYQDQILGGAGIAPLEHGDPNICELQKMYFLPESRGKGIGTAMMQTCLDFAKTQGFKKCYLETMPTMNDARKLYKKTGFTDLTCAMGDTGHYNCEAWMIKIL